MHGSNGNAQVAQSPADTLPRSGQPRVLPVRRSRTAGGPGSVVDGRSIDCSAPPPSRERQPRHWQPGPRCGWMAVRRAGRRCAGASRAAGRGRRRPPRGAAGAGPGPPPPGPAIGRPRRGQGRGGGAQDCCGRTTNPPKPPKHFPRKILLKNSLQKNQKGASFFKFPTGTAAWQTGQAGGKVEEMTPVAWQPVT